MVRANGEGFVGIEDAEQQASWPDSFVVAIGFYLDYLLAANLAGIGDNRIGRLGPVIKRCDKMEL